MSTDEPRKPSAKAIAAFERYWSLGDKRSLRKLAGECGVNVGQLERWSSAYHWQEQVAARQQEVIAATREAARKESAALTRRRLHRAQALQESGMTILSRAKLTELNPKEARELLSIGRALLDVGLRAERIDQSSEVDPISPPKPLADMTDAELSEYIARLERTL